MTDSGSQGTDRNDRQSNERIQKRTATEEKLLYAVRMTDNDQWEMING